MTVRICEKGLVTWFYINNRCTQNSPTSQLSKLLTPGMPIGYLNEKFVHAAQTPPG
jgi:hypothetical protein